MELLFGKRNMYPLLTRSGIRKHIGLSFDKTGIIRFFQLFFLHSLLISTKIIIFVRQFDEKEYAPCLCLPYDQRKLPDGYFKLNRLLYFIRAVGLPAPTGSRRMVGGGKKELYSLYNGRLTGIKRCAYGHRRVRFVAADYFRHYCRQKCWRSVC